MIRWKRSVYLAVCFSCLDKVECCKGRLALCVLHVAVCCTKTGLPLLGEFTAVVKITPVSVRRFTL